MKLADIRIDKNGNKKVDFFQLGIYDLIKKQLGFRFARIENKGYYLKFSSGIYEKSSFIEMQDTLSKHIETEFENIEINGKIDHQKFLEAYYQKKVLINGNYTKTFLSQDFELTENELHKLKMETNLKYKHKIEREEMDKFLISENFIHTTDQIGNFSKGGDLYYKQISDNVFLLINYANFNFKKQQPIYDFWKIQSSDKNEFLKRKNDQIENILLGFNLSRDMGIYQAEKNV